MDPLVHPVLSSGNPAQDHPAAPDAVLVAGQQLSIFVESAPLIEAMVADIRAAQRRVWLEIYIFENDAAGQPVADALKERAAAGLDVRVLYDAVGCQFTPLNFFTQLQAAGVKVHAFHSIWEALRHLDFFRILNRRDHRKLMVIDDAIGYFGGMNLVQTGNPNQPPSHHTMSSGWRDVHLRLSGQLACELVESFDRSWRRAHGDRIKPRPRSYRRALLPNAQESIRFFDSGPGLKFSRAARVYSRLIRHARQSITISMAYFIPVGRVLRALLSRRRKGVRVRIILPGQSDVPLAQYATCYLYAKLLKRGFWIYERERQMLHSKVMVVDSQWTVVGSCNMDPRSLWINLEFLAVIRSRPFAERMEAICRYEIDRSRQVKESGCENMSRWQRILNTLAWALRWWL